MEIKFAKIQLHQTPPFSAHLGNKLARNIHDFDCHVCAARVNLFPFFLSSQLKARWPLVRPPLTTVK